MVRPHRTVCSSESRIWHGTDRTCQYHAEQARVPIMHIRESGCAAQLWARPFLGHWLLVLSFRSSLRSSFVRGQVVRVMGLSFGYNLAEGLQMNVRVAERYTLDVERSIWLKARAMALEWHPCGTAHLLNNHFPFGIAKEGRCGCL